MFKKRRKSIFFVIVSLKDNKNVFEKCDKSKSVDDEWENVDDIIFFMDVFSESICIYI